MKRLFCLLLLFWLVALGSQIAAQSLLWEISGKGLKKPSYLFGTIHIQDKRVFEYGQIVQNKFDSCEAFAMELILDEVNPEEMKKAMIMENNSLDKLLSEEDYKLLAKTFKARTGQNIALYNKMKPFFLSSQMMLAGSNKDMADALDIHLLKKAREQKKKTFGIESFSTQMAAVNSIPLEEQAKMLMESIRDTVASKTDFSGLLEVYLNADLDKMIEMSKDSSLPERFNQMFLIERNKGMADKIAKFAKQQPTFNAIGAAHLGGEQGVIALLRKKGFTVVPIKTK